MISLEYTRYRLLLIKLHSVKNSGLRQTARAQSSFHSLLIVRAYYTQSEVWIAFRVNLVNSYESLMITKVIISVRNPWLALFELTT